MNPSSK
jgi:hypothetical protein